MEQLRSPSRTIYWGNFAKLQPIYRPYAGFFVMRFLPILRPYAKMDISLDENCPVRDKLLVENGLSYDLRPARDAIWVEVIGKRTCRVVA